MNKPQAYKNLIPIRDYAASIISTRGHRKGQPVTVQSIYIKISRYKKAGKKLPFKYRVIGKGLWIEV